MLSFKKFLYESFSQTEIDDDISAPIQAGMPKALHDFFWHLSAPNDEGRGIGSHDLDKKGRVKLIKEDFSLLKKHITEASKKSPTKSTPNDDNEEAIEGEENLHPLLKTSRSLDLNHPYHPLNIVRRGIQLENEKRQEHNDALDNYNRKYKDVKDRNFENIKNKRPLEKIDEPAPTYHNINHRVGEGVSNALKEKEGILHHTSIETSSLSTPEEVKEAKKQRVALEKTKKQKEKEAYAHFRDFMHREGGHAKNNKLTFTAQNGKTESSKGVGRNTIGLALAPHNIGHHDPTGEVQGTHKWDVCPNASQECKDNCLGVTAGGNRQYPVNSLKSKVLRQRYLAEHPEHAARILSKEIEDNEKYVNDHHSIHDKDGNLVGTIHKSGRVKSETKLAKIDTGDKKADAKANREARKAENERIKKHLENDTGHFHTRKLESGVRLNVTSDLSWHKLGDGKMIKAHPHTQFYDYTKDHRTPTDGTLPENYKVALSHTGDNHSESNSHHAVNTLRKGGVVAMVYKRGKDTPKPRRVKVVGSKEGEDEWHIADGDSDDNIDQRHDAAANHHHALADKHRELAHSSLDIESKNHHLSKEREHRNIANEYRERKRGVVSGLQLKGVSNEDAGHFANHVDDDGTIWLHEHPHGTLKGIGVKKA